MKSEGVRQLHQGQMKGAEAPELGLAYCPHAVHGILPGDCCRRSQGERGLIWAVASYGAEQKNSGARKKQVPPRTRQKK